MELFAFVLMNIAAMLVIYYIDRKNIKTYLGLGITAFIFVAIFEMIPVIFGYWQYLAEPKIWEYPVFIFFLYFPFMAFAYFFANKIFRIEV